MTLSVRLLHIVVVGATAVNGIKKCRQLAGLSQFKLSKSTGIERSRISLAECGHITLEPDEFARVRSALIQAMVARTEQVRESVAELGK
jgi:transcriptional regulator with XRE-family HTH domain